MTLVAFEIVVLKILYFFYEKFKNYVNERQFCMEGLLQTFESQKRRFELLAKRLELVVQ